MTPLSEHLVRARRAAAQRRYRASHLDKARENARRWRERERAKDPAAFSEHLRRSKRAWIAKPENRMRHVLYQARRRAARVGIPFALEIAGLLPLPAVCPVLGITLNYAGTGRRGFINDCPSLDRIDPAGGYVPGNVRVISWRANRIKSDATVAELRALLSYMVRACN